MWALNTIEKSTYLSFERQLKIVLNKASNKKIAIWGASVRGIIAGMILEDLGENEFIYIDNDRKKQGQSLSGHVIMSFEKIDIESTYIVISMEYQDEVRNLLFDLSFKEKEDFFSLVSSDYNDLMNELKQKYDNEVLVVGASILHTLPIDDRNSEDLSEMIKRKYQKAIKILGMTCLGMRNMYYLIRTEMYQNPNLRNLIIIVSWETLTSFHHILPRTQKPELIKKLKEYVLELGDIQTEKELCIGYDIAKERSIDYNLENKYSPARLDSGLRHNEVLKSYLDISIAEKLDKKCEEIQYLDKIIEWAEQNNIKISLVIEPMNMILAKEVYGKGFEKIYAEKCDDLKELLMKYHVPLFDASSLLSKEEFSAVNVVNEAIYTTGRKRFAGYIIEKIKELGNQSVK
ncbi:hypothetical protein [Roseburia sp. 499]|uniref:hypothetical protein n=1 Tax=Roseburia sp. 499 TaxID=1261634 RepID=UPI00117B7A5B|nr:hypothetical protein [Roseburia sp. 499]WVK70041.1 hypothetical protein BIV20_00495 [Roseburia sp. 499]